MPRLHREVTAKLIAEIAGGAPGPGELLEREVDLAQRFHVSRGVARECIRALEERGLVTVRHGRGAAVTGPEEWNRFDPDVLSALLAGPQRAHVLAEAVACRRLGEVEAASLAAQRAKASDRGLLQAALSHLDACAARARAMPASATLFDEADLDFHRAVVQASGNLMLGQIVEPVHRALIETRPPRSPTDYERLQEEHRRIVAAIEAGDPAEAGAAMRAHVDGLAEQLGVRRGDGPARGRQAIGT